MRKGEGPRQVERSRRGAEGVGGRGGGATHPTHWSGEEDTAGAIPKARRRRWYPQNLPPTPAAPDDTHINLLQSQQLPEALLPPSPSTAHTLEARAA